MAQTGVENEASGFHGPAPLWPILRGEWPWWTAGAIFSFVLASVLMSGWPAGLVPNLAYPYTYGSDGLSHSWMVQRVIEGWLFDNPRSGYPFGSNFLDYPGSDAGSLLILKLLGYLTGAYPASLNLYFLLSFPVTFVASFCVLKAFGLSRAFALCGALLFVFLPFHFLRLDHTFYVWYFVVPLYFYAAFHAFFHRDDALPGGWTIAKVAWLGCGFVVLASFGVYYALFGVIVLAVAGLAARMRSGRLRSAWFAAGAVAAIAAGVLINIAPNLVHKRLDGPNPEAVSRSPVGAELYGFKMMQLILPRQGHRIEALAVGTDRYARNYPLTNENAMSSLGAVGAAGFAALGFVVLIRLSGGRIDERLALLATIVLVLFLFGTIGGLGSLFAVAVSPLIRAWNRISVFIAFGSIAAFLLVAQRLVEKYVPLAKVRFALPVLATVFAVVGLYDQTIPACTACNDRTKRAYEMDRNFVRQIERAVPEGGAIYQLPYLPFPEVPPLHRLHAYDLAAGFLHSKALRWSYAGMKGREGDRFYQALAQEPVEKQIDVIRRLGFAGIYVDRRGYADRAAGLIKQLSVALGAPPILSRADGEVVFFRVEPVTRVDLRGLSTREITEKAGYVIDGLRPGLPLPGSN